MRGNPILVTGSHRSGSTWVGRMLARAPGVEYIEEPFHVRHRPGTCRARTGTWFLCVDEDNADSTGYGEALERTLSFRYSPGAELAALRGPRDLGRMLRDWSRFERARLTAARALIKDPIAFFSTPWLARRFDMQVVVLVRHPAAFTSSLKRLNWTFDVNHWLSQPTLMDGLLRPWAEEIRAARDRPGDVVDQAALLWRVFNGIALDWRDRYPEWRFIRHEDLSLDPLPRFEELFAWLGLSFTPQVRRALEASTSSANPSEAPSGQAHALSRDSRANVSSWRSRLEAGEIERLREAIGNEARHWYADGSW